MIKRKMLWVAFLGWALVPAYAQYDKRIEVFRGAGVYLGVHIRDLNEADVRRLQLSRELGVFVEEVEEGSPAAEAELQKGDIIWEYAGFPVLSVRQLRRLVADTPMGRRVELALLRGGKKVKTEARIGRNMHPPPSAELRIPETRIEIPELQEEWVPRWGRRFFFFSDRPRLGITAGQLTEQMADFLGVEEKTGVLIMEVAKDGSAHEAGLKAGDVIVSIDGEKVESPHDLSRHLKEGSHELEIVRKGNAQKLEVNIESHTRHKEEALRM